MGAATTGVEIALTTAAVKQEPAGAVKRFYRPELDWLRLVAFLAVYVHHAFPTTSLGYRIFGLPDGLAKPVWAMATAGGYGVDLFFTLSSFLITELLLLEKEHTGRVHVGAFYFRRMLRIWPLYFTFIFAAALVERRYDVPLAYYAWLLLFAGNWHDVFFGATGSFCAPLWSVSIEEQFYIVWPNLVGRISPGRFLRVMLGLFVFTCTYRAVYIAFHPNAEYDVWCQTFTRLDGFALGGLLACILHGRKTVLRRTQRIAALALAAGLFWFLGTHPSAGNFGVFSLWTYPLAAFASVMCIVAFVTAPPRLSYGKPLQALSYLGKISYGLYVFHMVGLFLARHFLLEGAVPNPRLWVWRALTGLLFTLVLAMGSYTVLEKPFLRMKRRFAYVQSRPE
ncbi:MAG: acyltransferase [Candidatus Hydrogenedentes bacterium]|nr:acyltransferase [Candidatus Hydrogenedentota bacterium]